MPLVICVLWWWGQGLPTRCQIPGINSGRMVVGGKVICTAGERRYVRGRGRAPASGGWCRSEQLSPCHSGRNLPCCYIPCVCKSQQSCRATNGRLFRVYDGNVRSSLIHVPHMVLILQVWPQHLDVLHVRAGAVACHGIAIRGAMSLPYNVPWHVL